MNDSSEELPDDVIEVHPPERFDNKQQYVVLYSCCCCCCCCLHTLGGVIGAAVAGATGNFRGVEATEPPVDVFADVDLTSPTHRLPTTQGLYWLSNLIVLVIGLPIAMLFIGRGGSEPVLTYLLIVVMLGPAFLLAGSVVMAGMLAVRTDLRGNTGYWKALGKITGGMVAGSVVGTVIMVLFGVLMSL